MPVITSTPHQQRPASFPARLPTSPEVLYCTHRPPCIISASNACTPTRTVNQSKMPVCSPRRQLVHNDSKKYPLASRGTPRTTLPSAAPKKIANSKLAPENTKSQKGIHMGL